jgi:predicted nucleotide-binding protein (sugar kinase/HSP70/actin superfamily)
MFDSHVAELTGQVDMVFVPRILSSLAEHIACPKLGALPDSAKAQFGEDAEVLTVDIDEAKVPLEASLLELGRTLKVDAVTIRSAIRLAREAMEARRGTLRAGRGSAARRFLILGHPYNLHDLYLSGPILRKLEALGVAVDMVDYGVSEASVYPIRWDTCSIMHDTIQRLDPTACAGVIQLSSFNCGCDSIVGELFRGMLQDKGIPHMTLVLDEHCGLAGIDTRLEAFVDSIGW